MTLALLFSVLSTAIVGAHTITFEPPAFTPSRTDWFGAEPSGGIGAVQRDTAQHGEFVFNDATKDQRILPGATTAVTREADLDWFGVTADDSNLYLLAKVENYCCLTSNPALELMVSIDANPPASGGTSAGTRALPDATKTPAANATVGISVTQDAAWEYVVDARFSPSSGGSTAPKYLLATPRVYTALNSGPACTSCKAQLVGASLTKGSFVEMVVPWAQIPLATPAAGAYSNLRFTVSTYYSNHATPVVSTPPVIDVLDSSTVDSLKQAGEQIALDKIIKTSVDVHFDATALNEPYAPLQITEFQANPVGKDDPSTASATETEWIELYNPNTFAVPLSDYKIGNAAQPGGSSQGMFKFKAASIAGKAVVIVARSKAKFLSSHPGYAGTVYDLTGSADFTRYTPWSNGSVIDLANGPSGTATNFEEQIILLDAKDGIVDMVTYGNPTKPTAGNVPISLPAIPEPSSQADEVSYERCPVSLDTNGGFDALNPATNNTDFVLRTGVGTSSENETPGQICPGVPGIDMTIIQSTASSTSANQKLPITITYSNIGTNNEPAGKVLITETLPQELTFPTTPGVPQDASVAPQSVSPDGRTIVWEVTAPLANNVDVGTITFTPTVKSGVPGNTPLLLTAAIGSQNELSDKLTNNTNTTTISTIGDAVLGLNVFGQATAPAGRQFQMTIGYSNNGQNDAENTTISLTLPAGVTLLSATSTSAAPNFTTPKVGPATVTWNAGTLPTNTNGTISIVGQVNAGVSSGTNLQFQVTASSSTAVPVSLTRNTTLKVDIIKTYLPLVIK
jgi:uncharacterized repeat protein (TIGR01451 family)